MNLGDVNDKTIPKMILVSNPRAGGIIATRSFIPHVCHNSIGVLAAVTTASACVIPGTVCDGIAKMPAGKQLTLDIEHPTGVLTVRLVLQRSSDGRLRIARSGVIRTARLIARGEVMVPAAVWGIDGTQDSDAKEKSSA